MRKFFVLFASLALGLALLIPATTHGQKTNTAKVKDPEVGLGKFRKAQEPIQDKYIVVFHDWAVGEKGDHSVAAEMADALAGIYGARVEKVFKHAINGFAAHMTKEQAEVLSHDPRIDFIEEDGVMHLNATQTNATWGLDRIDQRSRPLNGTYNFNWTGSGVRAYIIDTGIRPTHTNFGGRAAVAFDATGGNGLDCNGHGTHVAGTVGSSTWGVAKSVLLRGVRVFGCGSTTSTSTIISGVNWVAANRVLPAVANMSLGGGASSSLDSAVQGMINSGVTTAVAAGNNNGANACNGSPARLAAAITVGSTTSTDARSSFSNIGSCLDLFAPGSSITSTWSTSDTATATISGTSMASPHVAGAAALYLQANPGASPATVRNALVNNATTNVVTNAGTGSPNRLLYTLFF
jgi:subtilisin family serine protease